MSAHHANKHKPREPRRMREVDWLMVVGALLVAAYVGRDGEWALGVLSFFLFMFLFAIVRFVAALFRRRRTK